MTIRQPDFAGTWYPGTEQECLSKFQQFEEASMACSLAGPLRGGLVPHAGWTFSGRLAYNVLRELSRSAGEVDTVVLFGSHMAPSSPPTVLAEGDYWTPLGTLPVDHELAAALADRFEIIIKQTPERRDQDNTTELQAPLIKHFLPNARLLVVGAPPHPRSLDMAAAVAELASGLDRRLLAVGSTDLTHYGPNYGFSPHGRGADAEKWVKEENDRRFIDLACSLETEALIADALVRHNACCAGAAASAIRCGKELGATQGELLSYATSLDRHPADSFVGYAGIVF